MKSPEVKKTDVEVLRELAKQYAEIASLPVQREKMELWKAFNRHDPVRPMVLIDQLPWHELNGDGSMTCHVEHPLFRQMEWKMRAKIYQWKHFPVDMVVEPFLKIPCAVGNSGYGLAVKQDLLSTDRNNGVVSHAYHNQLQTEDDLEKIKDMVITHDAELSACWLEQAKEIFGGILPLRQQPHTRIDLDIWDRLSEYMGAEQIFIDLMERPEFIHKILERMTHSALEGIRQVNEMQIVDTSKNTCHCSVIYTDELLPDFGAGGAPSTKNTWGHATAQLFTSVSPAVSEEFDFYYTRQLAEHYGMLYYGCCDRLDHKLDLVHTLPNLKKVSCSPWSDREQFAEKLRKDVIMSNKPAPSFLSDDAMDCDAIAADFRRTCEAAKKNGLRVEMILKDVSTVRYQPGRLTYWANTAMKVVREYE